MRIGTGRLTAIVAAAAAALVLAVTGGASPGTTLIDGIPQRGTVLGAKAAQVTLIQYEDLGCTHCNEYMKDAFPTIVREYVRPGLVKVDFRGLGVVTRASEPTLRYSLAAARQNKLWQVVELFYENQARLNDVATDRGVQRMVRGIKDLDSAKLVVDAKSLAVRRLATAMSAEATRRNVPGTPWFFIKIGAAPPKLVRPDAYGGDAFRVILDQALGR